jgi:putative nucleotidyltransferase with HDIG domain
MLAAWLETAGYTCTQAENAARAQALLTERAVDVALLDVTMPGQDGISLARDLRDRHPEMLVILVIGLQRVDLAAEAMRLGLRDYLLKPFTRQDLLQSIRRAVEWRDSLQRDHAARLALQAEIGARRQALVAAFGALENVSAGALETLLVAQTRRNPAKAAHAVRVARMAVDLATALGVDDTLKAHIERGALLHDIGKIAMPDALMHKDGPFSEEEFETIRRHAQIGFEIVGSVPALKIPAELVLASHEAFDGSGYPRGLAGSAIPLGSRIIAVVDTFDALTWGRQQRDPVGRARAAAELVRCAGTQFDPDLVRAWLRVAEWLSTEPSQNTDLTLAGVETATGARS